MDPQIARFSCPVGGSAYVTALPPAKRHEVACGYAWVTVDVVDCDILDSRSRNVVVGGAGVIM